MEIFIRELTLADYDAYWQLRLEALENEPLIFGEDPSEHRALSRSAIEQRFGCSGGGNFVLGAFAQQRLVGTAALTRAERIKRRHKAMVWGVYVQPAWRGRGIATRLLQELIARAKRMQGLALLHLTVTTTNPAKRIYDSLGFVQTGVEPMSMKCGERYIDEYFMVLRLN
ncbi:MAG: GNAT family N-acetyltransferase [Bryobacteraceae bacterium]|nr:GNAT family N-acetyltransferase [Bryobacteraceae bacterium]MDW8378076.1 GNAT family N-acetyltransferase [Bryobacterales bacterium]